MYGLAHRAYGSVLKTQIIAWPNNVSVEAPTNFYVITFYYCVSSYLYLTICEYFPSRYFLTFYCSGLPRLTQNLPHHQKLHVLTDGR